MNKHPEDSLASDVVDGLPVDDEGQDEELIKQLQHIAKISSTLNPPNPQQETKRSPDRQALFTWGHLSINQLIGEGAYGQVYRAYDPILDREVALKKLRTEKLAPYQSRAFIQEARRLAKIRHNNVLAIHGANVHDGDVGMWSDLIEGNHLGDLEDHEKPFDQNHLMDLLAAMSAALNAVHEADLVHGDIKPSNVMHSNNQRYVLMDFGAGGEMAELVNADGYITGTPLYMAPELFNENSISPASDVYALGVLAYHLLTDDYPIQAKNLVDVKQAHATKQYQSLQAHRPNCSRDLLALVNQMLASDPPSRPSAAQISRRLKWIQKAPQRRQRRMALGSIFSILVLGIVFSSIGFYQAKKAEAKATLSQQESEAVNEFLTDMLSSAADLGKGREVRVTDVLTIAENGLDEDFNDQPHTKAAIHAALGRSYLSLQLGNEGLAHLQKAIAIQSKSLAVNDIRLLQTKMRLAIGLLQIDQYQESAALCEEVIALAKPDSNLSIYAALRLAENKYKMGEYDDALMMLEELHQKEELIAGSNIHHLLWYITADLHVVKSEFQKAEEAGLKALSVFNENHEQHDVIASLHIKNLLAGVYLDQGKFAQARNILKTMLSDSERLYGTKNNGYLINLGNYGIALYELGELDEALEYQNQSLDLAIELFGPNHFRTIMMQVGVSNTLVKKGLYAEGEEIMRDALGKSRTLLGETSMSTLKLEYNLTELLNKTNRFQEALPLGQLNNQKMAEKLGENHLFTMLSQDNLAVSYVGLGEFETALSIYAEWLPKMAELHGQVNPYYILVLEHQADAFLANQQKPEAINTLTRLLELQSQLFGSDHPDTAKTQQRLNDLN